MAVLLHICPLTDWYEALRVGEYRADSLTTEGFIHASSPAQVVKTADRFYRGRQGLVLLRIDARLLTAHVQYEAADDELFPHIYGPINLNAVAAVLPFTPDGDGAFRLTPEAQRAQRPEES